MPSTGNKIVTSRLLAKSFGINSGAVFPDTFLDEYKTLEYIENSDSQWIDTGVNGESTVIIRTKFLITDTSSTGVIVGYYYNPTENLRFFGANNLFYTDMGSDSTGRIYGGTLAANQIYEIESGNLYMKDLTTGQMIAEGNKVPYFSQNHTMTIFYFNNGAPAKGRMYYLNLYKGSKIVRKYIPVKHISDSRIGMYDLVEQKFYESSGNGHFTGGPETTLSDLSTVSNEVPRLYQVRKFLKSFNTAGPQKWKDIPSLDNRVLSLAQLKKLIQEYGKEYIKLEYLTFNGSQFINTGFIPKSTSRIQLEVDLEDMGDNPATLFGGRTSNTVASFSMWRMSGTVIRWDYGTRQTSITFPTTVGKFVIDANKNTVTINSTKRSVTAQTFTSNTPLRISSNYTTIGSQYNDENYNDIRRFSGDLYYFKIYDNDVLVRDFIPAKRKSDGTLGLYDLVTDVFYTNDGFGMFTSGPEVGYI